MLGWPVWATTPWCFMWVQGIKLGSSCCYAKCFTHWAISVSGMSASVVFILLPIKEVKPREGQVFRGPLVWYTGIRAWTWCWCLCYGLGFPALPLWAHIPLPPCASCGERGSELDKWRHDLLCYSWLGQPGSQETIHLRLKLGEIYGDMSLCSLGKSEMLFLNQQIISILVLTNDSL